MKPLYPYEIVGANQSDLERHAELAKSASVEIASMVFDSLPYLSPSAYGRRSAMYGQAIAMFILHVPQDHLSGVLKDLKGAAVRLCSEGRTDPPPPFELVCAAGHHVAAAGYRSFAKIKPEWDALRQRSDVRDCPETLSLLNWMLQNAETRLQWMKDGRPDLSNPRIWRSRKDPLPSFIEDYVESAPGSEEDRIAEGERLLKYLKQGRSWFSHWFGKWVEYVEATK